ncbi:hypothetical protein DFJ74DRAFT_768054 [Hyaloraphidium curvatum]|nr:hypothetical protein DFJ74DRAFT_768054 [Hyaloraphidium curvatum]
MRALLAACLVIALLPSGVLSAPAVPAGWKMPTLPPIDFPANLKTPKELYDYTLAYYKARNIPFGPSQAGNGSSLAANAAVPAALAANAAAESCGSCGGGGRRQSSRRITTNGCSFSPDYYFKNVCNQHDVCYQTCGASQGSCDWSFYSNMLNVCNSRTVPANERNRCRNTANLYYNAVSATTWFFCPSQNQFCECTCTWQNCIVSRPSWCFWNWCSTTRRCCR